MVQDQMQARQVMCLQTALVYIGLVIRGRHIAAVRRAMVQHKPADQEPFLQTVFHLLALEMLYHADRAIKQAAEMSLRGNTWQRELKEPKN
jgi:hypothetical protein